MTAREAWDAFCKATRSRSPLVGVMEAAEILGVQKSRISKLRDQGRLEPVIESRGGPLFLRAEVTSLARLMARERRAS